MWYECKDCGSVWYVPGYEELGGWFPDNEDMVFCKTCGREVIDEGAQKMKRLCDCCKNPVDQHSENCIVKNKEKPMKKLKEVFKKLRLEIAISFTGIDHGENRKAMLDRINRFVNQAEFEVDGIMDDKALIDTAEVANIALKEIEKARQKEINASRSCIDSYKQEIEYLRNRLEEVKNFKNDRVMKIQRLLIENSGLQVELADGFTVVAKLQDRLKSFETDKINVGDIIIEKANYDNLQNIISEFEKEKKKVDHNRCFKNIIGLNERVEKFKKANHVIHKKYDELQNENTDLKNKLLLGIDVTDQIVTEKENQIKMIRHEWQGMKDEVTCCHKKIDKQKQIIDKMAEYGFELVGDKWESKYKNIDKDNEIAELKRKYYELGELLNERDKQFEEQTNNLLISVSNLKNQINEIKARVAEDKILDFLNIWFDTCRIYIPSKEEREKFAETLSQDILS